MLEVVLVLAGLAGVGYAINGVMNKCPQCKKFGGMETVRREDISETSPYNRVKDGELRVFVKVKYREFKRCSACGYESEEIHETEREI